MTMPPDDNMENRLHRSILNLKNEWMSNLTKFQLEKLIRRDKFIISRTNWDIIKTFLKLI